MKTNNSAGMRRLEGKVVFLTGAGGALGGASAELFAMEGARIAVVDAREDAAQATVKRLQDRGGDAIALATDVRDESQVRDAVEQTVRRRTSGSTRDTWDRGVPGLNRSWAGRWRS